MGRKSLFAILENAKKESRDYASEFLADIIYATEKIDKINEREASRTITPSGLKCFRSMVFKLLGKPKDEEKRSYQIVDICANGSSRHESLQKLINDMHSVGIECEYVNVSNYIRDNGIQLRVGEESDFEAGKFETHLYSDKYRASFLCDGIIKYKGKYFILEIKTESAGKFIKQKDVMEEHKKQATAYSLFLGIDDVMFLYENRDIMSKKAYVYSPSPSDRAELREIMLRAIACADKNEIPEKPLEHGRDYCKYCSYKEVCHEYS